MVSWYQNVSILDFIGAKGCGGGGNNWSYKSCKAPEMSPPTNQHSSLFTGRMPFLSPKRQCQSITILHCSLFVITLLGIITLSLVTAVFKQVDFSPTEVV